MEPIPPRTYTMTTQRTLPPLITGKALKEGMKERGPGWVEPAKLDGTGLIEPMCSLLWVSPAGREDEGRQGGVMFQGATLHGREPPTGEGGDGANV